MHVNVQEGDRVRAGEPLMDGKIEDVGDTEFLIEEQVDRFRFIAQKRRGA